MCPSSRKTQHGPDFKVLTLSSVILALTSLAYLFNELKNSFPFQWVNNPTQRQQLERSSFYYIQYFPLLQPDLKSFCSLTPCLILRVFRNVYIKCIHSY